MRLLLALVAAVLLVVVVDVIRRPSFRRLAVRNVLRRPGEALLVVIGAMLGTAIITASLVVGDTLAASIRDSARTKLGEIDLVVEDPARPDRLPEIVRAVDPASLDGIDGALTVVRIPATMATVGADRRAEPRAGLVEVDFDEARRFGSDDGATGFRDAGPTPSGDEVVVGEDLADTLDLEVGDELEVFAYGTSLRLQVRDVVPRVGIAGFGSARRGSRAPTAFVAPGAIGRLLDNGALDTGAARPPEAKLLLSATGGVFAGAEAARPVAAEVEERTAGLAGVDVDQAKLEQLDDADAEGDAFTELFGTIGAFSVLAGILLLINIIVMLAEERKGQLGVLRALGMKRNHLVRTFGIEGAIYAVVSAVVGALAGVGVGRVISWVAGRLINREAGQDALQFRFTADPSSLLVGLLAGLLVAMVTVWLTSIRIGRLNVIRAIRDLPEPETHHRSVRRLALGALGVVAGGALFAASLAGSTGFGVLAGPALALLGAVPLLARIVPRRAAVSVPAIVALLWAAFAFSLLPGAFDSPPIALFVVQGTVLTAAAVSLLTANTDVLGRSLGALARGALAARLGLAYPLARRFRTGLLLGMYALVVFTLTMLATMSGIFGAQAPQLTADLRGGFDVVVDSSVSNPVRDEQLRAADPAVTAVAALRRGFPEFIAAGAEPRRWAATGFDEQFVSSGPPALESRVPPFRTDVEAWRAVLGWAPGPDAPRPVIIPDFFLQQGGGPPIGGIDLGEVFTMRNPATGVDEELVVVGVVEGDWAFNGAMLPAAHLASFLPESATNRHVVAVDPGADPDQVAERLQGALVPNGVDAQSFRSIVETGLSTQQGFFDLMSGYLGLGLLIGIAGLGVVMVRAVRERRREIGMLRAMGFPSSVVRGAFVVEAAFVAAQGVVVGVGLGLLTAWSVLSRAGGFDDQGLPFQVPWVQVGILLVVPVLASLLAVAAPATSAARIKPAAALRIAE